MKAGTMTLDFPASTERDTNAVASWFRASVARIQARAAERALPRPNASTNDALLRDIGIADDEIWSIKWMDSFKPRAWS